jgi:DNA-binding helix-hairpin-helix protein with protein kinase domain
MHYFTGDGQSVSLGKRIAAGGEGAIYEVSGNPKLLAKLYHKPPDPKKAAKLDSMVRLTNAKLAQFAAWPMTTLHERINQPVRGFLMPRVGEARPVHELDTPAHRRANYPHADWRFLIRTARNCAAAMTALHEAGIVVGDVNQNGFLVTRDALVRVIDCDSFQILSSGNTFLCEVAVPEFLPPELHGRPLSATVRTANHDAFGLAIVIFRLLMMGRHPFAGYRGKGDKPIPEAIKEYRFAFGAEAATFQMAPPPHSLLLADVSGEIATNFLRAFSRGSEREGVRPAARHWAESLARFESQLQHCGTDPGHYYFAKLSGCPWCRIERGNGPNYFISVSISLLNATPEQVDIAAVWSQIVTVPRPHTWMSLVQQPVRTQCIPAPLPENYESQRIFVRRFGYLAAASFGLLLFGLFAPALAVVMFPVCICFVIVWFLINTNSPHTQEVQRRRQILNDQQRTLNSTERGLESTIARLSNEFELRFTELSQTKERMAGMNSQESVELNELQSRAKERQLDEYLEQFFIKSAKLKGIGSGRIAALESFGVETAADISEHSIAAVPGFGTKLTEQLVAWRRELESRFRFDPVRGLPKMDLLRIRNKYLTMRHSAQRQLQGGHGELARITTVAKVEVERHCSALGTQRLAVAQARADLEVCSPTMKFLR